MLSAGNGVFLMIPDPSNKKILHPGQVLAASADQFEARFEEPVCPAIGADVNIYADVRGKFFQQGARLREIRGGGNAAIFVFDRVGEPLSAEQRQTYRVSTAATGIVARVGQEERCAVVDVSAEGFGAIASQPYEIGSHVHVVLRFWSEEITAAVRVQTVQARPDRKFRIGFLAPEKQSPARKVLQKISATIQRTQLSRLSGAA